MAVFPDRIALKNTTDSASAVNAAIVSGGTAPVVAGELVVRRASGRVTLHTIDSIGAAVEVGGVNAINDLTDVDTSTTPPAVSNVLMWNGTVWLPSTLSTISIDQLSDVDTTTKAPIKNQSLTWNGYSWVPGIAATKIGRGDGGDFDITETDSSFVFGVWGGGDFDTTSQDVPIELLRQDLVDGCEIVSDFTAETVNSQSLSIGVVAPQVAIGVAVNVGTLGLIIAVEELLYAGLRAYVAVDTASMNIAFEPGTFVQIGEMNYFSDWVIQNFYVDADFNPDWWAN